MAKQASKKNKVLGELLYGIHPVVEVLRAKRRKLISIYTTKPTPKGFGEIEKLMPKYPVAIQYVTRDVLTKMVQTTDHQGIVAWVHPFGFRKKMFESAKYPFLVMLDGIQDPRNTGAILRSAYCTNMSGVILCQKNAAPLNATAFKASAGLAEHLEIYSAPSASSAIHELQTAGYNIYLATFDGKNAATITFEKPTCIVIGSEGTGISSAILRSGTHVTLPQKEAGISYNASVAAGILLFLISTQHIQISK
jgi:23S rRNA (guanosine2251-2'-O)-methyltransferase